MVQCTFTEITDVTPTCMSREEGQQPKLLEATLVGLQAIKGKYGPGSTQAQAAQKMLDGVLAQIWQVGLQYAICLPKCTSRETHMLSQLAGSKYLVHI